MAMNENRPGGMAGGEERDPALDRLYRAAGAEAPPAHLDAEILAAAHRAVGAGPRARPTLLHRWRLPLSIAAVVVLSVSLVTLVQEEGGERLVQPVLPPRPPAEPAAEPARPATAPSGRQGEAGPPRAVVPAPAPVGAVESRRDGPAGAPGAGSGLAREALSEAAPVAAQGAGGTAPPPDAAGLPQPQPFRDPAVPEERRAAAPRAAAVEDAAAERGAGPVAAAPAAKPAPARAMASQARKETAAADARPPVWQGYENEPPQKWLERITELRRGQRAADADAMLAEFRRRFPDHSLPAEGR